MRWPATAPRCWRCWTGRNWTRRWTRPGRCWPPCWARTWIGTRPGCSGSPGGSRKDRVISTVDPEARHGHKTAARGFDGYKGHIGIDPDSEIITATAVGAGNAGDAASPKN